MPRWERGSTPVPESGLGVLCAARARRLWFPGRALAGRDAWLSEELRCRCVSCGQDVSGDEIVFVLKHADPPIWRPRCGQVGLLVLSPNGVICALVASAALAITGSSAAA